MGTRELPLPPADVQEWSTREELLFPDDRPALHSIVPGFDALTVGGGGREVEGGRVGDHGGERPAFQTPLPVPDIPPPTRGMARDDTSEISSAGREAPPATAGSEAPPRTMDPERKLGSFREPLLDASSERGAHRNGSPGRSSARNLNRQASDRSHNSAGSTKESKVRALGFGTV
jgi:hypothetical protein